jgi:hypothetical protein
MAFTVILSLLLTVAPPSGYINMIIWKDIPFNYLLTLQLCSIICLGWIFQRRDEEHNNVFLKKAACLVVASLAGSLAMHFRHNAWTVSIPLLLLGMVFIAIGNLRNRKILVVVLVSSMLFVSVLLVRSYLVASNVKEQRSLSNEGMEYMVHVDFLLAYKQGLLISNQETSSLEKYIGKRIDPLTIPGNSAVHRWLAYPLTPVNQSFVAKIERNILMKNKLAWIISKITNAWIMISKPSDDLPTVPTGIRRGELELNGIVFNDRESVNGARVTLAKYLAPYPIGGNFDRTSFLWDNFIVAFIIFTLSLIIVAFSYVFSQLKRIYDHRFVLIIGPLAAIMLSLPMMALSSPSNYRYLWPNINFAIITLVVWLRIIKR